MSMDEYYKYGTADDTIILNEYDMLVDKYPYAAFQNSLTGLWRLKEKKVIAFSATTSSIYERLIHNCIGRPTVLKFKSEFELVNGTSPIQEPQLLNSRDEGEQELHLLKNIENYYDRKPIIIIHDDKQKENLEALLRKSNYSFNQGIDKKTLEILQT